MTEVSKPMMSNGDVHHSAMPKDGAGDAVDGGATAGGASGAAGAMLEDLGRRLHKRSPLRMGKKIYEFYTAPVTKFWAHTVSFGHIAIHIHVVSFSVGVYTMSCTYVPG